MTAPDLPPLWHHHGYEIRPAWRRDDPAIEADAIAFWRRQNLLPPDASPMARAKELVAAAYRDGALVAVSTATPEHVPHLKARFFVMRAATDPAHRRGKAQRALTAPTHQILEQWALAHPTEAMAGRLGLVHAADWGALTNVPVWPESQMQLAGYTDDDRQIRLRWFDHYRLPGPPLRDAVALADLAAGLAGISIREAWRRDDPTIEADAIAFWQRQQLLPSDVDPAVRAKELILAAYDGDALVGLMTGETGRLDRVRAQLVMTRGAVDPSYRRRQIGRAMHLMHRPIVERWAKAHPEAQVAGLGGIVQSAQLAGEARAPYSPIHRYMLIGYTPDGHQLRVSWFEGATLE